MENNLCPTQEQFQIVIDKLESITKSHKHCPIDMESSIVGHCGTPMCHAGWYAFAQYGQNPHINYIDGADIMARDLGFKDRGYLKFWAAKNPKVWGNHYGDTMFVSNIAFGTFKLNDLSEIVEHWKGVKERANHVS